MWEIAPRYDQGELRNQYVQGLIYRMGDLVESLHTGLNTVRLSVEEPIIKDLCNQRENVMFKSWIRNVMEATRRILEG